MTEAYATYRDARKRLAEAKLSRGFYPVLALAPGSDGPNPSPSRFPLAAPASKGAKAKGKGRVKGSKGKNKGSSKSQGKAAARPHACVVANPAIELKALQVKTDFERDLCSVLGSEFGSATLGSAGEFLLRLDEGIDEDALAQPLAFDLITEEGSQQFSLESYISETGRDGPSFLTEPPCEDAHTSVEFHEANDLEDSPDSLLPAYFRHRCPSGRQLHALSD